MNREVQEIWRTPSHCDCLEVTGCGACFLCHYLNKFKRPTNFLLTESYYARAAYKSRTGSSVRSAIFVNALLTRCLAAPSYSMLFQPYVSIARSDI